MWSVSTLSESIKPQGNGKKEGLLIFVECKDKLWPSPGIFEQFSNRECNGCMGGLSMSAAVAMNESFFCKQLRKINSFRIDLYF